MNDQVFQLFVRKFPDAGTLAYVLDEPHLASFGPTMSEVRDDLSVVCRRLLDRGDLRGDVDGVKKVYSLRRVDLTLRAMQRGRLVQFGVWKSSSNNAVVFGSRVTGFSSGAAGTFTFAHSSMMDAE